MKMKLSVGDVISSEQVEGYTQRAKKILDDAVLCEGTETQRADAARALGKLVGEVFMDGVQAGIDLIVHGQEAIEETK